MAKVVSEAGISFDPRVVEILRRRYVELEKLAREQPLQTPPKLSTDIKVERGLAPDAGFAESPAPVAAGVQLTRDQNELLSAAQKEMEIFSKFGSKRDEPLTLEDMISLLAVRIRHFVPHDSLAVYVLKGDILVPEFVSGDNFRLFSALRIPVGEGLSGWVAQNSKPILNGNPSVEPGYLNDPTKYSTLRSALAVPLEGKSSVVGVLALYRVEADAFTREDLNLLQAATSAFGAAIENCLRYSREADSVTQSVDSAASAARAGR
jgi:GAF domain-containing protein